MTPNWRQLAALPDCALKQAIIRALNVDVPPAGISRSFRDAGLYITRLEDGFSFLDLNQPDPAQRDSRLLSTPGEVLRAASWPQGTPTGEALRNWLCHHGHSRPGKGKPAQSFAAATGFGPEHHDGISEPSDPNHGTKMIT